MADFSCNRYLVGLFQAVMFLLVTAGLSRSNAEPVTFQFEAEIDRLSGTPFDSGIEFAEGDVISGQFTFEPDDGNGDKFFEATQPYDFLLNINGVRVGASSYSIESIDDGHFSDLEEPIPSVLDVLNLGGELSAVNNELGVNINPTLSAFRAALWGPTNGLPGTTDTLETAMIPADVETWNRFIYRRQLSVAFRSGNGDVQGFQATIGELNVVPEPSTGYLLSLLTAVITLFPAWRLR